MKYDGIIAKIYIYVEMIHSCPKWYARTKVNHLKKKILKHEIERVIKDFNKSAGRRNTDGNKTI